MVLKMHKVAALIALGALVAAGSALAASGASNGSAARPSWCGPKKVTVSLSDGFGANSWREITRAEAQAEAKRCPSVQKFIYTDGQGKTDKAISDIQGLVAQGVNAMVVFPDAGKAILPALKSAFDAGVAVVPYRVSPGGKVGVDYSAFVGTQSGAIGTFYGKWLKKVLKGKGDVVYLGGPAGNSWNLDIMKKLNASLKGTQIKVVGQKPFTVTNWDPAQTQQAMTALLAKYPEIDAVLSDFGLSSILAAYKAAKKPIPAQATQEDNQNACDWATLRKTNPKFQLLTTDAQTWMVRSAIDVAVAKASGGKVPKVHVVQKVFQDSLTGKPNPVKCVKSLPGEAFLSAHLTRAQIKAALK